MRRESEDYIPRGIRLCNAQVDRFEKEYGHRDYSREWRLPVQDAPLPFHATAHDFSRWIGSVNGKTTVDEWGIGHESSDEGANLGSYIHPMANMTSLAEIKDYPFPSAAKTGDVEVCCNKIFAIKQNDMVSSIIVAPVGGTIFWPAYKMRGMENLLCDFYQNPDIAEYLLDTVTDLCVRQAAAAASAKPDIMHLADDFGTQISTYVSPDIFKKWFKPRLAAVISAAKKIHPEVMIFFHSDGAIQDFIPDFIEIGVDILNPLQPECMDPVEIKKKYGSRLSFNGCLGTQTTLPFGTPDDVRKQTRYYCEEMGRGGGFWIAPTHLVEPEVPWENILAFIKTTGEYE